jgi:DNA polymerase-4
MMTKTISITLRDESFKTMTRSKTIKYTDDFYDIFDTVSNLLDTYYEEGTVLRLVGVGFSNLKDKKEALAEEYNLFTFESFIEREEKVKEMLKELQDKYGTDAIHIGIKKDDN